MPLFGNLILPVISRKKDKAPTRIPLPDIDSFKDVADIDRKMRAVERFPGCVLLTKPILFDQDQGYQVKETRFTIKSNDQGWSDEDNFPSLYEGSWTWFEVAILRPSDQIATDTAKNKRGVAFEPFIEAHLASIQMSGKLRFVVPDKKTTNGPFWHLQRNRRGRSAVYEHKIVWRRDATEFDLERIGWEFDSASGQGSGFNFSSSLQSGDRILLVARAKQSGRINYISAAEIEVDFEGFVPQEPTQIDETHPVSHELHPSVPSSEAMLSSGVIKVGSPEQTNSALPSPTPSGSSTLPKETRTRKRSIGVPGLSWVGGTRSSTKPDKEKTGEMRQGVPMRSSNTISAPSSSLMGVPVTEGLAIGSASVVSLPSPTAKERAKMFFGIGHDLEGSSNRRANTTVSITEESDNTISAADSGST